VGLLHMASVVGICACRIGACSISGGIGGGAAGSMLTDGRDVGW